MNQLCENLEKSSKVLFQPTHHNEVEGLVKRLRMKADTISMGEKIEWGSETALMYEAADALTTHSAKERREGFNEGMKAVRCQTAEEAYERGREEERWRCHGIVGNYLTPPRINLAAERRINMLLESLQEDINDPEQMPIDEDGKFILTPQTDVTKN